MDLDAPSLWWLAVGALVAAELATGTFYLLMLALGAAAGAMAAHAGVDSETQVTVAAAVGGGAVVVWHFIRRLRPKRAPAERNRDVNIDIGQRLHVTAWDAEGTARVPYRGASWAVRYAGDGAPAPGEYVIVALDGNELRVAPAGRH
ncbi:MAG: NfeD family protein [Rubrivivax sp.]|nr:NfeD family protein [Rubrivivax sp.]